MLSTTGINEEVTYLLIIYLVVRETQELMAPQEGQVMLDPQDP